MVESHALSVVFCAGSIRYPKNLAASIAIEAAEIMERFRWYETGESRELVKDEETRTLVAEEVADVMIYCLALANPA